MTQTRYLFLVIFALGVATTAAFHASGALDARDALTAATLKHGIAGSPPQPLTSRALGLGVDLIRLVYSPTLLFRAMHLTAGILLAVGAGLSAIVAFRLAGRPVAGLAAALFVGSATLFGGDLGRAGLAGGPLPVVLVLLASAAAAWTATRPAVFLGGLLLGAATAEHPFVLFLLPGFITLGVTTSRLDETPSAGVGARAALGFTVGMLFLFAPVWDTAGRLSPGEAVGLWAVGEDPFWSLGGPRRWVGGFLELVIAIARNAGPVGLLAGLAGLGLAWRGAARLPPPFILLHLIPAAALVLGQPTDLDTATALVGWSFLFWTVPAAAALVDAAPDRGAIRAPAAALVAAAVLFAMNARTLDRSAEHGIAWARESLLSVPQGSLFLSANPVHLVLATEGARPDVDIVYVDDPSTLEARAPDRTVHAPPLRGRKMTGEFLSELVGMNHALRPVIVDPNLFFDIDARVALLGTRWKAVPHGLSFRIAGRDDEVTEEEAIELRSLWDDIDLDPQTPPSPLRDGKTGAEFYARILLQDASLYLNLDLEQSAETEFLLALSLEHANHSLAATGLGRLYFRWKNFGVAIETMQRYLRETDDGAWIGYELLGNTCLHAKRLEEAIDALELAIATLPPEAAGKREIIQRRIDTVRSSRPSRGTTPSGS